MRATLDANSSRYFPTLLLLLIFLSSELVVAVHRFTSILDIYVLIDKNIYSQLKRFVKEKSRNESRKKPKINCLEKSKF